MLMVIHTQAVVPVVLLLERMEQLAQPEQMGWLEEVGEVEAALGPPVLDQAVLEALPQLVVEEAQRQPTAAIRVLVALAAVVKYKFGG